MTVKLIKLLSGEDLIAKVLPSSDEVVKMENPVRIVVIPPPPQMQYDPKRATNVGFAPWAEFSEDKVIVVDKSNVIAIMNPIKEFANQYNAMFGKLVVPTGSNLILPG